MRFHALATDYDGTIAHHGTVDGPTIDALKRLKESGRKLLLVTGRELDDLFKTFEHPELFDRIVAENGALVYDPATKDTRLIGTPPPPDFVAELVRRGVGPISLGKVIVATWEPHQSTVLDVIREQGLELQVIFNKGAVMVLPSGINKATGLSAALAQMGLSAHNVVAVGDAENDHAMMELCGCSAAVENAISAVKERSDISLTFDHGAGVAELVAMMLSDGFRPQSRGAIRLGKQEDDTPVTLDPISQGILICGSSGSGKSTLTTGLLERTVDAGYQIVIFDPEGDYDSLDFVISLGSPQRAPLVEEVMEVLRDPGRHLSINMLGVALEHRPAFFAELLPRVLELRTRTGRPHVMVVDEAHHLLPVEWHPAKNTFPEGTRGIVFITVHPESMSTVALDKVDAVIAVGEEPEQRIGAFCSAAGVEPPSNDHAIEKLPPGDVLLFERGMNRSVLVHSEKPVTERKRHSRKYAEGNLGPIRSFYFRGREGKLNLKAHNLMTFLQLADGVDDETWDFHLKRREYSHWLQNSVKDSQLALEVERAEGTKGMSPAESRLAIREAIEKRYTLPADKPSGKID
jgi:hydroxymethylpyrimidine pyrophosphatase-like HAD family hydrolase